MAHGTSPSGGWTGSAPEVGVESALCRRSSDFFFPIRSRSWSGWERSSFASCPNNPASISCGMPTTPSSTSARRRIFANGWVEGRFEPEVVLPCGPAIQSVRENLEKLLCGQGAAFCDWIWALLPHNIHRFDKSAVEADLELLTYAERIIECHGE
jgi:hypothetical protein